MDEGETVLQFCVHGGSVPPASISWTQDNDIVVTSSRVFIQTSVLQHTDPPQVTSTLAISPVEQGDSGSYRCIATNEALGATSISEEGVITIRGEYEFYCAISTPSIFNSNNSKLWTLTSPVVDQVL